MLTWSNTATSGASATVAQTNVYVNGASGGLFLWTPTAMSLDASSTVANQASRTSTTCYMKGLSEHLRIQTSSGQPWFHRRICFTTRGLSPFLTYNPGDTPIQTQLPFVDTSNGIERLFFNANLNNMGNTVAQWVGVLFKGLINKDWNDYIVAPIDTTRINVKFDKTWTLQSGNQSGIVRERKLWHPMNKNLVYDDDENGDLEQSQYYSTSSKAGMGDYFVMDFIAPGAGASSTDIMQIVANSTLYWHEK